MTGVSRNAVTKIVKSLTDAEEEFESNNENSSTDTLLNMHQEIPRKFHKKPVHHAQLDGIEVQYFIL